MAAYIARFFFYLFIFLVTSPTSYAQPLYASTTVEKKKVIIEEFTGVRCPACPFGHAAISAILNDYPTNFIPMAYHPKKSISLTKPLPGDPDLRLAYTDTFWTKIYGNLMMPSATINRRTWPDGHIITFSKNWKEYSEVIMQEDSPLNIGLNIETNSFYFDVNVEVYFTSTVTDDLSLYVHLIQDVDVLRQKGSDVSPYTEEHVLRKHITQGQWGDDILGSTTQSSLYTASFFVHHGTVPKPFDIDKAKIVAFVYNKTTGEIITGQKINANGQPTSLKHTTSLNNIQVSPNPSSDKINISFTSTSPYSIITIFNALGQPIFSQKILGAGNKSLVLSKRQINTTGLNILRISDGNKTFTQKIIFE